jgi:MoxR-like ATPase
MSKTVTGPGMSAAEAKNVSKVVERVTLARDETAAGLVERDVEAQLLTLAIVCKCNLTLVGSSGWAKSQTIRDFVARIEGARVFETSMSPTTEPERLLGPLDIGKLERGVYERVTTGRLPEAHVAVLDEGYRASDAVFDDLLPIANERIFENNGVRSIPLWTLIMSTNHVPGPDQPEMAAFVDRMALGKLVKPVASPQGRRSIIEGRIDRRRGKAAGGGSAALSIADIELLQSIVPAVEVPDDFLEEALRLWEKAEAKGLEVTGRRFNELVTVCQGVALLDGRFQTHVRDLQVSQHVLWKNPEDEPRAYEVALDYASEHDQRATEFMDCLGEISEDLKALRPRIEAIEGPDLPQELSTEAINLTRRYRALSQQVEGQVAEATVDGHDTSRLWDIVARVQIESDWIKHNVLGLDS